jgi:N-acetylglucosaminyl-diphospho-decaprenol L-rhamnosyltransferase
VREGAPPGEDQRPRVDVGIVTWNTAGLTVEALRHLRSSEQGCDLRVLVWDNASSDGTADAIRAAFPDVEVTESPTNLGFAVGVNRLLERSEAPWFLALNSDAWPEAGAIGTLVRTATANPRAALVAPRLERPDGQLEHSTHPFPSLEVAGLYAIGRVARLPADEAKRLLLEPAWQHDEARPVDWAVGAAWLLRRAAVDEVGALDESFFMYAEDLEWCWRARQRGWEVLFEPAALVRHVGDASGQQARDQRARTTMYLRNTNAFFRRAHGPVRATAYRALNAIACGRMAVVSRRRGDRERAAFWLAQAWAHLSPSRRGAAT